MVQPREYGAGPTSTRRYAGPDHGDFDDKICLEVMLRNVAIRKGYTMEPKSDAARVIEITRTRGRR